MRKQLIACGVLTLGLAVFGCHNEQHEDNGNMPTTQKSEAAPQQDNTAVAQNDDTSATDTEAQQDQTPSTSTESTESVAQTDQAENDDNAGSDENAGSDQAQTEEAQTDESTTPDDGEQAEVAEVFDGTQFDADEFVAQVLEASTQDPFSANTNNWQSTPSQKKVNTASTDGDQQP